MPRGKPRRGQFAFTLFFPGGGRYGVESHRDLAFEEWKQEASKHLDELKQMVTSATASAAGRFESRR
jgi:hypothetical protein